MSKLKSVIIWIWHHLSLAWSITYWISTWKAYSFALSTVFSLYFCFRYISCTKESCWMHFLNWVPFFEKPLPVTRSSQTSIAFQLSHWPYEYLGLIVLCKFILLLHKVSWTRVKECEEIMEDFNLSFFYCHEEFILHCQGWMLMKLQWLRNSFGSRNFSI